MEKPEAHDTAAAGEGMEQRKRVSPIFSVFGIFNHLFKCDWLHCADHGVSADFLGNEFDYLVNHKMPGASKAARCAALGEHMNNYYATNGVEDRLKEFLPKTYAADRSTRPPGSRGMLHRPEPW